MLITIGRSQVNFTLRNDERLVRNDAGYWFAEFEVRDHVGPGTYKSRWIPLGIYETEQAGARALYVERAEFNASYGCDAVAGVD